MSDPNKGKYRRWYKQEMKDATERLAPLRGQLEWGVYDYEAFTFKSEEVKLIFYPHRTSAGNYHIRVRDAGSPNKERMREAISMLAENSCTFQCPSERDAHDRGVSHRVKTGLSWRHQRYLLNTAKGKEGTQPKKGSAETA